MPGHSRPKDGVLSHAYVPGIHDFISKQDVDGISNSGLPELLKNQYLPQVGYTRLAGQARP
jgi:hypothetical protein